MSRLEIIHLRISGEANAVLGRRIAESAMATADSEDPISVYCREGLESDLAVHIHHAGREAGRGPSALGLRLAAALREYGLVEHTQWEELE